MKKHIICLLCTLVIASTAALPARAQTRTETAEAQSSETATTNNSSESSEGVSVSVSEGVIGFSSAAPTEVKAEAETETEDNTTVSAIGLYPFEIKYETHNGAPVIIKSFRLPAGSDPASLIEDDFTEDGFIYSKKDILVNEPEILTDGKTVAEPIVFATKDNDQTTILADLSPVIDYNEGGYSGQLVLDYSSIVSSESGKESYSYPITRTVEVNNLADNDYAYLDKDLNGLTLESADWDLNNGIQRASNMIPGNYTAQATYTGIGYRTRATGYTNTAYYTGYVTRTTEGSTVCSIVYKGMKDPSARGDIPWTGIFIVLAVLLLVGGAVAFVVFKGIPSIPFLRNRRSGNAPPVEVPE